MLIMQIAELKNTVNTLKLKPQLATQSLKQMPLLAKALKNKKRFWWADGETMQKSHALLLIIVSLVKTAIKMLVF